MSRVKNRLLARLFAMFPSVFDAEKLAGQADRDGVVVEGVPFTPLQKPLSECTVAIVTTAGVHLVGQEPFDMADPDGDPTFRAVPSDAPASELTITHDYYDHRDADADINIVFPVDRLREMAADGVIGGLASTSYGFMGHITGPHVRTLMDKTAPEAARRLKAEAVDAVLLTPG